MKLKQKFIMLSSIGFGIGVIAGTLIAALWGSVNAGDGTLKLCSEELIDAVGNPLLAFTVQALVSGLYGVLAVGGSVVYSIEEWGLVKCTVIHYVAVMTGYFALAFSLHWISVHDTEFILIMLAAMTAGYIMIWLINFLSYRKKIKQINQELNDYKEGAD